MTSSTVTFHKRSNCFSILRINRPISCATRDFLSRNRSLSNVARIFVFLCFLVFFFFFHTRGCPRDEEKKRRKCFRGSIYIRDARTPLQRGSSRRATYEKKICAFEISSSGPDRRRNTNKREKERKRVREGERERERVGTRLYNLGVGRPERVFSEKYE